MTSTSHIEISETALRKNLAFIREELGETCKLSAVVKGNAYGHGIQSYVPMARRNGVDHFSVFSAQEAFEAFEVLDRKAEIMIMGMIDNADLEWAITNDVGFFVFEIERVEAALKVVKKLRKPARLHLELETGMNRTGFEGKELKQIARLLSDHPDAFELDGICTHYAGAESIANYVRIQRQIRNFSRNARWLSSSGIHAKRKHTACSAAAMSYPKTRLDMARIGIMQYGYWPSRETLINYLSKKQDKTDPLRRVISWKSSIMSIQTVKTGEFVGYGTTFMANNDMTVAIVPVGYAHGYSRSLSNQGRVLIGGHRVSVIGLVNMNMLVADVTGIPNVRIGDEVVLIGRQGDHAISVSSFGELSDQLNYELLTRLPHDIPRIVTE